MCGDRICTHKNGKYRNTGDCEERKKEFNKKLWIYEKLGTVTHKEEKNQSIKTDTEMAKTVELTKNNLIKSKYK